VTRLTPPELRARSDSLLWKPSTCVRASGKSIGTVAKDLGLTETAVRAWVRASGGRSWWRSSGGLDDRASGVALRSSLRTLREGVF
jgi:hypothetical protein